MSRRSLRAAIAVLLVLVIATGCTSWSSTPSISGLADVVHPVWRLDVPLVGDPVVRDGVVASYVHGGSTGLEVRAWSLADGHELWRHEAHVSKAPAGEPLSLTPVRLGSDEFVAFLAASASWSPSELAVAGLATGRLRSIRDPAVEATSRLDACGHSVCFEGWSLGTGHLHEPSRPLRVDLAVGRIRFDPTEAPEGGFAVSDHLFAVGEGGAQQLESTMPGAAWRRDYGDVFGGGATTAGGWAWRRIDGVQVGVGGDEGVMRDDRFVSDLGDTTTVGLDPATGMTLWRLGATRPCPGATLDDSTSGRVLEVCRVRGSASAPAHGATLASVVYRDVQLTRVGVDVRDGRVLWRRPVPDAASAIRPATPTVVWAGRWDPIRERGRMLLLDRKTGRAEPVAAGSSFLCRTPREVVTAEKGHEADAGASLDPCSGGTVSRGALERSAIDGGDGWWVVPGGRALSVYSLVG